MQNEDEDYYEESPQMIIENDSSRIRSDVTSSGIDITSDGDPNKIRILQPSLMK